MKQRILLTIVLLMVMCSFSRAKEAYAVYDSGDQTLTFRYDDEWDNQPASVYKYDLNTGSENPGWIKDGKKFKRVVFTSSFASYRPTSTCCWFSGQTELTEISGMSYLKTDNVTIMRAMFYKCSGLTNLTLSGWNTGKVTDMHNMFNGCSGLTSLTLSGWDTGKVKNMMYMFYGCSGLTSLNVSGWNTGEVTDMSNMFMGCEKLTSLDVSGWNTSNVTSMFGLFRNCSSLPILDVSRWNTSNVTNMKYLFDGCTSLKSLDVGSWNTGKVKYMHSMFYNCIKLTSLNLSLWDTSNLEDMYGIFQKCHSLKSISLRNWDTSNVTTMDKTFEECLALETLDLGGWVTSNVTCNSMFSNCTNLTTIYVGAGWDMSAVTKGNKMFLECVNLLGGSGTVYDANHTDRSYAHIDGGPSNPGYFSVKKYNIWVGGIQVNDINKNDVLGDGGSVKYTVTLLHRLTLENANITNTGDTQSEITGYGRGIYSNIPDLTVRVKGNNTIDSKGEGIYFTGNLSILGSSDNQGKLSVKGSYGIRPAKNSTAITLNISRVELTAEGTSGAGIGASTSFSSSSSYNCTMKVGIANTVVKAKGKSVSLGNLNDLVFEDGLDILQPTGAVFSDNKVKDASGNVISKQWVVIGKESSIATGLEAAPQIDNGQLTIDNSMPLYNLQGQRVTHPVKGGIYIQNGHKRIIK
ncbi:MAG: BspA family leucine-rich repeat surface protein [Prevotella sp.]|nr:BspA family leucine-rich repeat surface protein [Prevotella sp.]